MGREGKGREIFIARKGWGGGGGGETFGGGGGRSPFAGGKGEKELFHLR